MIEISIKAIMFVFIIFIIVTEHLMNWWIRTAGDYDNGDSMTGAVIVYLIRLATIIAFMFYLLSKLKC